MADKKSEKISSFNTKLTVITIIASVWIICIIIMLAYCELQKNPDNTGSLNHPDLQINNIEESYTIPSYKSEASGTVSKEESKTLAHFLSHYKNDYYRVNELQIVHATEGEYYQTEIVAYSTKGYLYKETFMSPYEEIEYDKNSQATLMTPDANYTIYHGLKNYFIRDGNSKGYTNEIDFSDEEFVTGNININGRDYYYEEVNADDGYDYKYCFNGMGELAFRIVQTDKLSITEQYMEYSKDVDYSLFEIPQGYTKG